MKISSGIGFRSWLFGACLSFVSISAPTAPAADYAVFDYGDIDEDVSNISFYKDAGDSQEFLPGESRADEGLEKPRNVILMIGDGMGFGQVQLARAMAGGAGSRLFMEQLPFTGIMRTHAASAYVTDSAASGTAMACGVKTDNGVIGMNNQGQSYLSVLELAESRGKRSGLVTSARISHATPAVFAAHVENRKQEGRIASQLIEGEIEVLLGGGRKHWLPEQREDGRDLIDAARGKGYAVATSREEFEELKGGRIIGLFQDGHLKTFAPEPSIVEMTRKAIETLDREEDSDGEGFFLMVEGAQIDFACHAHNVDNTVKQTLLFDLAVRDAVSFAKRDGQTLVVVTADHETGGLVIFGGSLDEGPEATWSSRGHSAMDVPVYAYGPGALRFTGVMDNTELAKDLAEALSIEDFPKRRQ